MPAAGRWLSAWAPGKISPLPSAAEVGVLGIRSGELGGFWVLYVVQLVGALDAASFFPFVLPWPVGWRPLFLLSMGLLPVLLLLRLFTPEMTFSALCRSLETDELLLEVLLLWLRSARNSE